MKLIIISARYHACQIHETVLDINAVSPTWDFLGFVADGRSRPDLIARRNASILCDLEQIDSLDLDPRNVSYVIGAGLNEDRKRIDEFLSLRGFSAATIVHPAATVATLVTMEPGCYVGAQAVIQTGANLGRHVHINIGVSISPEVVLGDYVRVSPGACVLGYVNVGDGTSVGANAAIREELSVGAWATIGMGAMVVKNVEAHITVVGVPARVIGT